MKQRWWRKIWTFLKKNLEITIVYINFYYSTLNSTNTCIAIGCVQFEHTQKAVSKEVRPKSLIVCVKIVKGLYYCRRFRVYIDSSGTDTLDRTFVSDEIWFHLSPIGRIWRSEKMRRGLWWRGAVYVRNKTDICSVCYYNNNNNNYYYYYYYYYYYLLQLGCHPVAVVILHVCKIWNWLLLNLSREGYMRNM